MAQQQRQWTPCRQHNSNNGDGNGWCNGNSNGRRGSSATLLMAMDGATAMGGKNQ
jgi:hypothetical protein